MRRLKPDPVPNELIRKILEAGVCAPSGGNMQRWRFFSWSGTPRPSRRSGPICRACSDEQVAPRYRAGEPAPGMSRERFLRLLDAAGIWQRISMKTVWIVPCLEGGTPTRTSGSSTYPAMCRTCCWRLGHSASARPLRPYLASRRKRKPPLACRLARTPMPCCRWAIRWDGLARFAGLLSLMSSTRIGGVNLSEIRDEPLKPLKSHQNPGRGHCISVLL